MARNDSWPVRASVSALSFAVILFLVSCRPSEQAPRNELADPSGEGGSLEGIVSLAADRIPRPTRIENSTDPDVCGSIQTLEDLLVSPDNRGIQNVIVALKDVPAAATPASTPRPLVLDNRDCRFVPHVSVLTVGSTIRVSNSDPTLHTTHLYGALTVNLALPFKGVEVTKRVDQPGLLVVKCDVHGWMQAYVRVDRHAFHAVTDESGYFRVPNIPPGTYTLEVWHEKLGLRERIIHIQSNETERIDVEFQLVNH